MTTFKTAPFRATSDTPLYLQLYAPIQQAILSGELKGGMKLPATRALADELGVSRNTVFNAYEQLMAEGYLESVKGSGTFVARVLPDLLLTTPRPPHLKKSTRTETRPPRFSERAQALLNAPPLFASLPPPSSSSPRPFNFGMSALDFFPHKLWARLIVRHARSASAGTFNYQDAAGYRPLREAIAAHVTVSRRVHCTAEHIVIVSGAQGALDLAARLLINTGDAVWMEDPGYFGARGAFLGVGAQIVPVPIDEEGLLVAEGIARAPNARLAYITPSHQFPLGVTMSLARRLALLDWAKQADGYVLEDDYDSEYRFAGRPLAALQGIDDAGRVIYIGTFSKVLFPSLRIGYLILPPPMVNAFLTMRALIDVHTPILEQHTLADFISEGHFRRHLRRMRIIYAERRATLLEAARELPLEIHSPEAGFHCIGWLPDGMDDLALVRKAAAHGLDLWTVSDFSMELQTRKGLVLGYGEYSVKQIREGVRRLAAAMRSVASGTMDGSKSGS